MRKPSSRVRRIAALAVVPLSMIAAAVLISNSTFAAFSSTTRNSGNNWRTGSVSLTDDDLGAARFQAENMVPEQTGTKCITVTSFASVPGTVRVYLINPAHSVQNLESHIMLTVRIGDGGGFNSCTGFVATATIVPDSTLATGMATRTDFATGAGNWTTAGVVAGESKTYEVTWRFDTSGMTQAELDGLQGASTGVDVQWELRNI
jgi:hypothetical protein